MKRSAFKPSNKPMARTAMKRPTKRMRQSAKKMKSGKITPTAEEKRWMAGIVSIGCIVCLLRHGVKTSCAVHHIIEGGRRRGHIYTIGLCDPGHHQNTPDKAKKISRHPDKARFEAEYGDEYFLLNATRLLLE